MLAYSEGFNPHPRLSLAALRWRWGLPVKRSLMDVYTVKPMSNHSFTSMVSPQLPSGLEITQVYPMPLEGPTLQAQIRFAEYEVSVIAPVAETLKRAVDNFMAQESIPWQHQRDTGIKSYDLRKLINSLWVVSCMDGVAVMGMKLRCSSDGAGRPEQVVKALGLDSPLAISRTRLVLQAG